MKPSVADVVEEVRRRVFCCACPQLYQSELDRWCDRCLLLAHLTALQEERDLAIAHDLRDVRAELPQEIRERISEELDSKPTYYETLYETVTDTKGKTYRMMLYSDAKDAAEAAYRLGLSHREGQWRNAALRVGEQLTSVGPDGYYAMTPERWLAWALRELGVNPPPEGPTT